MGVLKCFQNKSKRASLLKTERALSCTQKKKIVVYPNQKGFKATNWKLHTGRLNFSFSDIRIQERLPRCRRRINSSTRDPSSDEVVTMLRELLHSSLSEASIKLCSHAWVVFTEFYQRYQSVQVTLPVRPRA